MLGRRRKRWTNIKAVLDEHLVSSERGSASMRYFNIQIYISCGLISVVIRHEWVRFAKAPSARV